MLGLLRHGKKNFLDSGVEYGGRIAVVKQRQQLVQLTQRLTGSERLPSKGEQRTARRIGHPERHAPAIFDAFDEQLALPSLGIELDCPHLLTEERMQKILDFDGARIAGIIRQRL